MQKTGLILIIIVAETIEQKKKVDTLAARI